MSVDTVAMDNRNIKEIMMKKKKFWKLITGCILVAAVLIVCVIVLKNRESHPVWNEVRVNDTVIEAGQSWQEMRESLENMGLSSENDPYGFVPRKDDSLIGLNISKTISEKKDRVQSIYYNIDNNESDYVIELAGIRLDQGTIDDVLKTIGPEDIRNERETLTNYIWTEKDYALVLHTDKEDRILGFDLYYDRKGFKGRFD